MPTVRAVTPILEGPPISISLISSILLGKLRALILLYISIILISLLEKGLGLGLRFRVRVRVELTKVIKAYYLSQGDCTITSK